MATTTSKVWVGEYDRAEWPETSQVHVSEPDAEGMVTVTELTGSRPSWVEGCGYCANEKPGGFYPSHFASGACRSGGHSHCTCDTCF